METMYQYVDLNGNGVIDLPPISYVLVRDQQLQTAWHDCSKCDSIFTSKRLLREHEISAHGRSLHCPFCPSLFSNKSDFRTHINAHPEKNLTCCKKTFHLKDEYTAHVKKHTEPSVYRCDRCPAYFLQLSMLRKHYSAHVKKKFVHNIPEISENCSSKKLLKKVRKELRLINKITRAKDQRREDSRTAASVEQVGSVSLNSVPSGVSTSTADTNIRCDDDIQMVEPDIQTVLNSNREKNIPKNDRSLKKKPNPTSDASTSISRVSRSDPVARVLSKKNGVSLSAQKPILEGKKYFKRKQTPPENVNPNYISKSSTSSISNGKKSAVQLKRKLKSISRSRSNEAAEWDDEILAPSTSNKSSDENSSSSAEINVERNIRPRNTVGNFASSSARINVARNLRPRNTEKNFYREVAKWSDENSSSSTETIVERNLRPRNIVKNFYSEVAEWGDENSSSSSEIIVERNLRPRNIVKNFYSEVAEWNDEIPAPPTNNKSSDENSSSSTKINVERNLRPRNTVGNFASSSAQINVKRNLRPRNTDKNFYSELFDSNGDFVAPSKNNESNEKDFSSSAKMNSERTLRPRNTVKNLNRGFCAVKPEASYDHRRGAERKNVDNDETLQSRDDKTIEKRTTRGSKIPTGFFMCLSCGRMFQTYRLLNQHKELHIRNTGIRCDKCGGLFGGPGNLVSHRKSLQCCAT